MAKIFSVFVKNSQLDPAGIQAVNVVAFTTGLMLIRFSLDGLRHRSNSQIMRSGMLMLDAATYSPLQYSLGIMQRPSEANSYYQVWAVLLVTLRYSVKIGRPAGIALRQTPLVDLVSSFWAANILRSHAVSMIKIPVWLLWSINSARIIHGFVSSEHATASHKDNVRLVAEYMRREHDQNSVAPDPSTMEGYRYLVLGEGKQKKEVRPPRYRLELKPTHEEKLITLEKIWRWEHGDKSAHGKRVSKLLKSRDGKLRNLCLSFALYKLLRRRFYNLPIYESKLEKTKRLIFDGVLCDRNAQFTNQEDSGDAAAAAANQEDSGDAAAAAAANQEESIDHKRVFRITKTELSFLNDFFYSRHALVFANGFPFLRLFLSTLLVGAISYMAVAIHQYSKIARLDELGRVHHGVVFTWILLSFLGLKEIIEIAFYVFSDWTKVLLVCNYARQPWWLRGPVMEIVVSLLCRISLVIRWHGRIGQYNLIFGVDRLYAYALTDLPEQVQRAVLRSLKSLRNPSEESYSYLNKAFSGSTLLRADELHLRAKVHAKVNAFKDEVQRILLWHIATCYCELHLADTKEIGVKRPFWVRLPSWLRKLTFDRFINKNTGIWTGPFVKQSELGEMEDYITAIRLSQYCAHLLRLDSPLIPGNDIVTKAVLIEVYNETRGALCRCYSISETFAELKRIIETSSRKREDEEANNQEDGVHSGEQSPGSMEDEAARNTLLKMGSQLGQDLIDAAAGNNQALWAFLAELWAGFVLHLAQSTRASDHKLYLSMGGEFMTHLWALLSHAGLTGNVAHGEMGTGAMPFAEPQCQALDINNP